MNKYEETLSWLEKTFNQYLGDWQLSSVHFGLHRDLKELQVVVSMITFQKTNSCSVSNPDD